MNVVRRSSDINSTGTKWRDSPTSSPAPAALLDDAAAPHSDAAPAGSPNRRTLLVLTPYFPPAELAGGPARTLEAMIRRSSSQTRSACAVVTTAYDLTAATPMDVPLDVWTERGGVQVRYTTGGLRKAIATVARCRANQPSTIYLNSLWHPIYSIVPVLLRRVGWWGSARFVVAPRGELGQGAMSLKNRKKQMFLLLSRVFRLHTGVTWHASSPDEKSHILAHFPAADVEVRENETLLPLVPPEPTPPRPGVRSIAFLGRLTRNKGAHLLLEAAARLTTPVQIDIYGNAEDPVYAEHCRVIASAMPSHVVVRFRGAIAHDSVLETLRTYDLMALPTSGENFSHAIAEALCAGCPVMLAPTTPWTEAARKAGTLVDDLDPQSWARALNEHLELPDAELEGRKWSAQQSYLSWRHGHENRSSALDLFVSSHTALRGAEDYR